MNNTSELKLFQQISRKTGLTLGAITLCSGLIVVGTQTLLNEEPKTQTATMLSVEAVTAEFAESYTVSRVYSGEVVAGRISELGFEQGGELIEIRVDRGNWVKAGQLLARLDTRRLEAQRSQLVAQHNQAIAQLEELRNGPRREDIAAAQATAQDLENQLELERLRQQRRESLYIEGAISREDRDIVAFGVDALEERLEAARSQLEELQNGTRPEQVAAQQAVVQQISASIADIDIAIEKSKIFAPFSGVVATRQLDEGAIMESGQPVFRLVEQSAPEVEVGFPVDIVTNLALGQPKTFEIGGQSYEGKITAILPEVDPTTRTQTVVFRLGNGAGETIAPEQLAEVEIARTISTSGFWLSLMALTEGERGLWSAYALMPTDESDESNLFQVQRRELEILHTEGDRAFVRGLIETGDRIVTDGVHRVIPGQIVQFEPK
ncbi:MAG TPA: efflux RND transporter periplasmic adaptor subunit [Elainellaceae cyanobacterium]